jgi:hypothetical protein
MSIEVGFGAVQRQNRWTVAFRSLLLIPQAVVLLVLEFVAGIFAIVGWFAALVLGRLPSGIASFLTRVLQYNTRFTAYGYLLFDAYPPFTLSATNYPATVEVHPTRLNRLAVLFRMVLMIPAVIVNQLATGGIAIASLVVWLIVLIAGRMPRALSEAVAAIVRYQTRVFGYVLMVTSTYPAGLFGDHLLAGNAAVLGAPLPTPAAKREALPAANAPIPAAAPTALAAAVDSMHAADVHAPTAPVPATPAVAPVEASPPVSHESPRATALVLSSTAKRLVGLFLALGLVGAIAYGVLAAALVSNVRASVAAHNAVVDDYNQLSAAAQTFQSDMTSCPTSASALTCAEAAYGRLAIAAARFDHQLASVKVPSSARADLAALRATASRMAAQANQLSHASDANTFGQGSLQFATLASSLDSQVQQLLNDLP